MPLLPLRIPPGVYRNGTEYQSAGRWYDANGIRWFEGVTRPIGGWIDLTLTPTAFTSATVDLPGVPRCAVSYRTLTNTPWLVVGTHTKLYAYSAGELYDITPAAFVVGDPDATVAGSLSGYGSSVYGGGLYGAGNAAVLDIPPTTWQLDAFGNFLVGVQTKDGRLFSWASDSGVDAVVVAGAPTQNAAVVTTPERFVFALGANNNVKRVQWPSQETLTDWTPTPSNSAGFLDLETNGRLICGRASRQQTLLWTDVDMHAAQYIGGDLVYSFSLLGENCGTVGPNAVAMDNGVAFWMGPRGFFLYDGFVKPVSCEVSDYVFGSFNVQQRAKVFAVAEPQYGEIWWFYPSSESTENDRYVVYNYREGHWSIGRLARTAGVSRGTFPSPIYFAPDGRGYEHEVGTLRPGMTPWAQSGPVELTPGDQTFMVRRVIPDERTLGETKTRLFARLHPTDAETSSAPLAVRSPTDVRLSGRQFSMRVTENVPNTDWRVGTFRLDVAPRGSR